MQEFNSPNIYFVIALLTGLSLAPFMAIMVTSFTKISIVLSLIRNALGVQQVPSNMVINGLAIILSFYIMTPVGFQMLERAQGVDLSEKNVASLIELGNAVKEPMKEFLIKHSKQKERLFFIRTAHAIWPEKLATTLEDDDLMVLVPAFTVTELTAAFQIGFLLYLPFIAIDLVVSNVLLAMGMMMVSPMTISLPFKLLLFVLVDGWSKLIHGLIMTYV